MKIDLNNSNNTEYHICDSILIGHWIVYTCPSCKDWKMQQNLKTGEMITTGYTEHFHKGSFSNLNQLICLN